MASDYPNILQVAPIPRGSTKESHSRLQGITSSLTELGYDSVICTYAESKSIDGAENLRASASKKNVRTQDQLKKCALSSNLKLAFLSLKTFNKIDPVAIHSYGFSGLSIAMLIKLFYFWKRTPVIVDLNTADASRLTKMSRYTPKILLAHLSTLITCPNKTEMLKIQEHLGLNNRKISLVVDGINSFPVTDLKRKEIIRQKLRLPENKTVIVVNEVLEKSSLLKDIKNIIMECRDLQNELHFVIIGNPKKYLQSYLKKSNVKGLCTFVGDVDDKLLPQYYSIADIALAPSYLHEDKDRIKLLTFMANELPVIAYDGKNQQRILSDNSPLSHSLKDIISNIKDLHYNKKWQSALAHSNAQRFDEFYSWQVSKEQLHATYVQALS